MRTVLGDKIRAILKERTKGEVNTWGFVAMFMDMIDEAEKETQSTDAEALRECLREALEWVQDASPAVAAPWEERARELTKEG